MAPNQVLKYAREKQDTNINFVPPPRVQKLTGGGLFQDYEWMPDSYDSFLNQKKIERVQEQEK